MKKLKITLMSAAVSFACSQSGICAYLVGSIDPGSPASITEEVDYVETLLGMGANDQLIEPINSNNDRTFTTFAYDAAVVPIVVADYVKFDPPSNPASVTGYQFVLAKFGNTSWVWELTSGETFVVPQQFNGVSNTGNGISHYSVFNKTTTRVPDGGTTIALLGMSLLGLGGARRFFRKA